MAKKVKLNSETLKNAGSKLAVLFTLAGVAISVHTAVGQTTSAEIIASAASEDQNPIVHQLSEEESSEMFSEDAVIISSNRFDSVKDAQSENSEIPNEVELEKGNISENLTPEIQDMVNEANKNLQGQNPEILNPEINPNQPNSETVDQITSNLPNSEELKLQETKKSAHSWGLAGGAGLAVLGVGATIIGVSKKHSYKDKKSTKSGNEFFMGGN